MRIIDTDNKREYIIYMNIKIFKFPIFIFLFIANTRENNDLITSSLRGYKMAVRHGKKLK